MKQIRMWETTPALAGEEPMLEYYPVPLLKLVAQPPGKLCFSSSSVLSPPLAVFAAAIKPPLPAPTTITS